MKITKTFIVLFSLTFWVNFGFSQNLSLNQLLDSALENNYLLQSNKINSSIKQTDIEKLKINFLPVIGTSATFSYWNFLLPNKERVLGDNKTDFYNDITLYQKLYDFGATKTEKSRVVDEILLNDEVQRQIRQSIIYGVGNAYFAALSSEMEIQVHQNTLERLEDQLRFSQNLFDIGKISNIDLLKIKVQISVAEKNLEKAKNDYLGQKINLQNLCYTPYASDFSIENNALNRYNQLNNKLLEDETGYRTIAKNHPLITQNIIQVSLEKKQQEIYKLQNRPELFGYSITTWENAYTPFSDNFNFNVGLGVRYTIPFLGGSGYKYQVTKSNYLIEQLNVEKDQTLLEIKSEIDLSLNNLNSIRKDIENQQKIINLATETIDNSLVKYKAGQGSIIDILDAQSILSEATLAYNKSIILFLQSMVKLHYLSANNGYPFE